MFYSTLTSCQVSEKLNEAFSRNARRGRTYGRDRIYRTPVGSAGAPINRNGYAEESSNASKAGLEIKVMQPALLSLDIVRLKYHKTVQFVWMTYS